MTDKNIGKGKEEEWLFAGLRALKWKESVFSRIMRARTVQELIDSRFDLEELIPLFQAAEELAREEEEILQATGIFGERLMNIRPIKRRRMFFV